MTGGRKRYDLIIIRLKAGKGLALAVHSILAGLLALMMWITLGTIGQREESLEEFLSVRGILDLVRQPGMYSF